MKPVEFLGDALQSLKAFPVSVQKATGVELHKIQLGLEPSDWKPMPSIGAGVRELRIRDRSGAYRVVYVAQVRDAIVVLHAFQKKTQRATKRDIEIAAMRFGQIDWGRK
ncbi:hypothetical protein GJW-30_1_00390 [Variibacter gotjawalensis]|uniref:Type II toxin-antitoxin system RelE/ParE family toxin n=1 Tax=Variibacter gotjawalensis TaxID=1333996 RepID=A0A0S3PPL3_9BRAD|nr:type II toxin-antitoxin system RelE/ParE family toxin [Variibacter gotjawalensis]NIK48177.1 phage-related protein [Variibacter gotjawalensis]RZS50049.1 phage-related protein [Variibacter gotjawalensis]BAT57880.1 hypothetical protein GJW-30_1_00390 [Variibacter gotjawalensis]